MLERNQHRSTWFATSDRPTSSRGQLLGLASSSPHSHVPSPAPSSHSSATHVVRRSFSTPGFFDGRTSASRHPRHWKPSHHLKHPYDPPYAHKRSRSEPRRSSPPFQMSFYSWWRLKRLLSRPLPWILILVLASIGWWGKGASRGFQAPDVQQRLRTFFPSEHTKDLQFFPASNHKIHVCDAE